MIPLHRRRFLKFSGLATVGLGLSVVIGEHTFGRGSSPLVSSALPLSVFSASEAHTLRAVALRILCGADPSPTLDGGASVCTFVDGYVAGLAAPLRTNVRGLLHLVELYPLLSLKMARFGHLRPDEQDAMLAAWQDHSIGLLRQGFFALKSLCVLAQYQDPRSFASIGYDGPKV
ncbi:MAG TPA: twin-arginine translocation signal domain-containing protein [Pseudomonadota bacterium]|nr:twin-arginine translocation signal domain-containing protein [Pseudomonadota bacterium]